MNVLVSYFFAKKEPDRWDTLFRSASAAGWNVLLDSGAYSAWTQNEPIDLARYCRFIERRREWLWDYVMLDVVGSAEQSKVNLRRMRDQGLLPMAVLTDDALPDTAPELIDLSGNARLCVAGGTHWNEEPIAARMELVRRAAPSAQVHALGLTRGTLAWRCPVATIDSSTWMVGVRFGKFSTFDRLRGCVQHDHRKVRESRFADLDRSVREAILASGISKADLTLPEFGRGTFCALNLLTAEAWLRYAAVAAEHGRRFFFATTAVPQLIVLAAACRNRTHPSGVKWREAMADCLRLHDLYKEDRARFVDEMIAGTPWLT